VLMLVAAPLLVLGVPLIPVLWALPLRWRRRVGGWGKTSAVRGVWGFLDRPLTAWILNAAVLWVWHAPALYQATLRSEAVHIAQHLSFLGAALLFWWVLVYRGRGGRAAYGIGVLYVFTTALHSSVLGALLTFAPAPWYPAYVSTTAAWGLTPLEDQQLAGLIMWVPGGIIYLIASLALFAAWLRALERETTRADDGGEGYVVGVSI
jgi:putative membrane protein